MKSSYVRTSEKEKNIMAEKKNEMARGDDLWKIL